MPNVAVVAVVALALMAALCVVVGMTLRHHIGGFIENVAREEREREEAEEAEAVRAALDDREDIAREEHSTGA